jgi:hypothetical protein
MTDDKYQMKNEEGFLLEAIGSSDCKINKFLFRVLSSGVI